MPIIIYNTITYAFKSIVFASPFECRLSCSHGVMLNSYYRMFRKLYHVAHAIYIR